MSLYTDLLASTVYAPTLTGGAKPRPWNVGAQSFNGTSELIVASSGSALGLSNTCCGSVWVTPSNVTGTRCLMEFSGLTHGVALWIIDGSYWFSVHRSDATIATVQASAAAIVGVASHLFWQVSSTGIQLWINGVSAGSQTVAISTSNATDAGGVGAVYSDSRLPSGVVVDLASPTSSANYFAGVLADLFVWTANHGAAGALAMWSGDQSARFGVPNLLPQLGARI